MDIKNVLEYVNLQWVFNLKRHSELHFGDIKRQKVLTIILGRTVPNAIYITNYNFSTNFPKPSAQKRYKERNALFRNTSSSLLQQIRNTV